MIHLIYLLFFIPVLLHAEVFYWQDENGRKHYSDKPQENAKTFSIKNTVNYYSVKRVSDGDTIVLDNGMRVRLLGINAPEIAKLNVQGEAGAKEAKQWLTRRLENTRVYLKYDVERQDKYNRSLAYVFTEEGLHLNLELVRLGLATTNIYPPNLNYLTEFLQAEQQAEQQRLGLWKLPDYQPKKIAELKSDSYHGWQRVVGKIKNLKTARKYHYLNLSHGFSIKISKKTTGLFPNLEQYVGKTVEVRGWVRKNKQYYNLFVRHPSAIKIIK